ncbi:hypothetical protein ACFL0Y_03470 [Patescibacteria group bacterium]
MKLNKRRQKRSLLLVFWLIISFFSLTLASFFIPVISSLFQGPQFMLLPLGVFILGGALVWLTLKQEKKGLLRKFLLLTGGSAMGLLAFSVLHNLFYAVEVITKDVLLISRLAGLIHALFFIVAVIICPIGFLVGAIGTILRLVNPRG